MVTRGNSDFVAGIEAHLTGIIKGARVSYTSFKDSYFSNVFLHLHETNRSKNISNDEKDEIILKTAADAKRVGWVFGVDEKALEQQLLGILTPILRKRGITFEEYFKTTSTDVTRIEEINKLYNSINAALAVPMSALVKEPKARKYVKREEQKTRIPAAKMPSGPKKPLEREVKETDIQLVDHNLPIDEANKILHYTGASSIYNAANRGHIKLIDSEDGKLVTQESMNRFLAEHEYKDGKWLKIKAEEFKKKYTKAEKKQLKPSAVLGEWYTLKEILKMPGAFSSGYVNHRITDPNYKKLIETTPDPIRKNHPYLYKLTPENRLVFFKDAKKPSGLEAKVEKSGKEEAKGTEEAGEIYGLHPLSEISKMPGSYKFRYLIQKLRDPRYKPLVTKEKDPKDGRKVLYDINPTNAFLFFKDAEKPEGLEGAVRKSGKEEARGAKATGRYGIFSFEKITKMPNTYGKWTLRTRIPKYNSQIKTERDQQNRHRILYEITPENEFIFFKDAERPGSLEKVVKKYQKRKPESAGEPQSAGKEKNYSPKSTDTDKKYTASFSSIYLLVLPDDARKEWVDKGWSGKAGELSHYANLVLADKGLVSKRGNPYFFDPKEVGTIVDMVCKEFEWAKKPEEIKFVMTLSATKDYLKFAHDIRLSVELLEGKYGDLKIDFDGMKVFLKDKVDYAVDKKQFTPVSMEEIANANNLSLGFVQTHRDVLEPIRIRAGEQSGYCLRAVPEAVAQLKKLHEAESTKV